MPQLPHMETIGVRELQQHVSAALRRVRQGEIIGVTDRGHLIAVLAPATLATGTGALIAAGRVQPARAAPLELGTPIAAPRRIADVLGDLRDEG